MVVMVGTWLVNGLYFGSKFLLTICEFYTNDIQESGHRVDRYDPRRWQYLYLDGPSWVENRQSDSV